jgi:hypothetical protein
MRKGIETNIQRRLYAESMGRCMNPKCETELFLNGDIAEKAHIIPYCETADNSFDNLILLCPNCHTDFDKNLAFDAEEVKNWKIKRQEQLSQIFTQQFGTFKELEEVVKPILQENRTIYENYYLKNNPTLWKKFENNVLINNQKLKLLLGKNKNLFPKSHAEESSNLVIIEQLILHIDEFRDTREESEKIRTVLFPQKVNAIFGLEPCLQGMLPSVESLECLINKLQNEDRFVELVLGVDNPFLVYKEQDDFITLFLNDTPRIRQIYFTYRCLKKVGIRLESLNFALKYMNNNQVHFIIENLRNLSKVVVNGKHLQFIYEYCLSKVELISLSPPKDLIIVNLHNWNGKGCISKEAYEQAEIMDVKLLTMDDFYRYVQSDLR